MVVVFFSVAFFLSASVLASPRYLLERHERSSQVGVDINLPPRPTYTGILPIPDSAHPFISPGPDDQRGPCPGLNTLANHGYIPRNGIVSFEQMITALTQAFNMDYDLASAIAGQGLLGRGNAFINKVSIGLQSPQVPPLPDNIDGPVARGLAAHGRLEGDASMTRDDFFIGDHKNFQPHRYAEVLSFVNRFGENSTVTGPRSIVNVRAMQELKYRRFLDSQTGNKKFEYHSARMAISYGEAAFTLGFFANGTDGLLSVPAMTSFFRDQKFPENYYRRSSPLTANALAIKANEIYDAYPVRPGANDANGTYVLDPSPLNACSLYNAFVVTHTPAVLLNTTGLLKRNVDFLLNCIHVPFPDCPVAIPSSPAGI